MGDRTTHRLPDMRLRDMDRLPDMDRQKTRHRLEALLDIRPRRDMDLRLHLHPEWRPHPHQGARGQAARTTLCPGDVCHSQNADHEG
jgi:hypothetical protein